MSFRRIQQSTSSVIVQNNVKLNDNRYDNGAHPSFSHRVSTREWKQQHKSPEELRMGQLHYCGKLSYEYTCNIMQLP